MPRSPRRANSASRSSTAVSPAPPTPRTNPTPPAPTAEPVPARPANLVYEAIPAAGPERPKYLIPDAVGIAPASTRYDFAYPSLCAAADLSQGFGDMPVIGLPA